MQYTKPPQQVVQSLSSKGQVVIPAEFRQKLSLVQGQKIVMNFNARTQEITLRPLPVDPIKAARGFLSNRGVTLKDLLEEKYADIKKEK